jgi:hypothetical protein
MRLIENVSESLQNEMRSGFAELRAEMRTGFDRVGARLDKHGGLLNGGARQITRLIEWSEKVDGLIADRDRTIEDLKRRVEKLESKQNGKKD